MQAPGTNDTITRAQIRLLFGYSQIRNGRKTKIQTSRQGLKIGDISQKKMKKTEWETKMTEEVGKVIIKKEDMRKKEPNESVIESKDLAVITQFAGNMAVVQSIKPVVNIVKEEALEEPQGPHCTDSSTFATQANLRTKRQENYKKTKRFRQRIEAKV